MKATFTDQEKYALAAHMMTNIIPKDTAEGMRFYDTFQEVGLTSYKKIITGKDTSKTNINDFDIEVAIETPISSSTCDYLLEILNKPMGGVLALSLVPVARRLRALQLEPVGTP